MLLYLPFVSLTLLPFNQSQRAMTFVTFMIFTQSLIGGVVAVGLPGYSEEGGIRTLIPQTDKDTHTHAHTHTHRQDGPLPKYFTLSQASPKLVNHVTPGKRR
jgi:hypothetical protein